MKRGFFEVDALIALVIIVFCIGIFLASATLSVDQLREKITTFEQIEELVIEVEKSVEKEGNEKNAIIT